LKVNEMSTKLRIEQFSKQLTERKPAAGYDHFQRVFKTAIKILKTEGLDFDPQVVHAASYLHDIGEGEDHQVKSARQAIKFLSKISFPSDKLERVRRAILEHIPDGKPESNEAIALHDADLLDFLGATGVTRLSYSTTGWFGKAKLEDTLGILMEYRKIASENLILNTSKKLAREKVRFMNLAIKTLESELK